MIIRKLILPVVLSFFSFITNAQDGSDIIYVKFNKLDSSYIGDTVQIDFYRRSFGGKPADIVKLVVENTLVEFKEHRVDNGYNNWFHQQYLESTEKINGYTIRINKMVFEAILDSIPRFTIYFDFYTKQSGKTPVKTETATASFDDKMIFEILVSAESHNKKSKN